MKPHYVYILFRGNRIIYVGMTCDLKKRLQEHSYRNFSSYESERFATKQEAYDCEKWMIEVFNAPANRRVIKLGNTRKRASFAIKQKLKTAIEKAADKAEVTVSQYIENMVNEAAKQRGLIKE